MLPLETLLERMSAGPAAIFGLERPRIAVGAPANLTLIDTEASWRVKAERFRSRSQNSWLLGKRLRGRVQLTIAAGQSGARAVNGHARARGRDGLRRRVGRRGRVRVRRGRLHDLDERLPGGRDRPELRGADRLLHRADGRQLRRRRGAVASRSARTPRRS